MMTRREFSGRLAAAAAGLPGAARAAQLGEAEAARGVRAALERGALAAVGLLGRNDGFLGNPRVRIPLPPALAQAERLLRAAGQGRQIEELTTTINRAAEAAVPQARALFVATVKAMSVEDALSIVRGGDTAVTEFFARKTRQPLGEEFLPIVTRATAKLRLAERYDALAGKAAALGLLKGEQTSLPRYVTAKALDGLYLTIGDEERKLRADPVGTGSALLARVFGR